MVTVLLFLVLLFHLLLLDVAVVFLTASAGWIAFYITDVVPTAPRPGSSLVSYCARSVIFCCSDM